MYDVRGLISSEMTCFPLKSLVPPPVSFAPRYIESSLVDTQLLAIRTSEFAWTETGSYPEMEYV